MGNSSSSPSRTNFKSDLMVSKPSRLARRASTSESARTANRNNPNLLSVPNSSAVPRHRRTRSAVAHAEVRPSGPPPSYSVAITTPPPGNVGPTTASQLPRPGSRHTNVFITPPSSALPDSSLAEDRDLPSLPSSGRGVSSARSNTYLRAPMRRETMEDALETLRKYDTVLLVDDSRSMHGELWEEARDALAALAETAGKYDANGIDVYFLNDQSVGRNMTDSQAVRRLFDTVQPKGITPIGERLEGLFLEYILQLEEATAASRTLNADRSRIPKIKPVNYIVLTDGVPTDDPESVIVTAAKRLDKGNFPITQVGIQFVQIGNSRKAAEFLKELDDNLATNYGVRDMVDTTSYTGGRLSAEVLTKILLGGINRRVDKKGGAAVISD